MQTIAITGGIGSGKSHLCRLLEESGAPIFYADPAAKHIIRTHPEVQRDLRSLVGTEVYDAQDQLVKTVLARYLCQGIEYSRRVDAIVHPRVAEAWQAFVAQHDAATTPYIYMECALLFESGFERLVDKSLLVTCDEEERIRRVMHRDGIDRATVLRWMALQMPEAEKRRRADWLVESSTPQKERAQLVKLGLVDG